MTTTTATPVTAKPMNFSMAGTGSAGKYGNYYWAIGLPDGREVYVWADQLDVLPTGVLQAAGRPRPIDELTRIDSSDDERVTLLLAPGCWVHAYAASVLNGCPIMVDSIDESRTP